MTTETEFPFISTHFQKTFKGVVDNAPSQLKSFKRCEGILLYLGRH